MRHVEQIVLFVSPDIEETLRERNTALQILDAHSSSLSANQSRKAYHLNGTTHSDTTAVINTLFSRPNLKDLNTNPSSPIYVCFLSSTLNSFCSSSFVCMNSLPQWLLYCCFSKQTKPSEWNTFSQSSTLPVNRISDIHPALPQKHF